MTQNEIIRMAREAGFGPNSSYTVFPMKDYASNGVSYELERFAALVAAHEREKQAEQEPVAFIENGIFKFNIPSVHSSVEKKLLIGKHSLYAAPVRTKDLTDDEIYIAVGSAGFGASLIAGCRAVIAADRSKNGTT